MNINFEELKDSAVSAAQQAAQKAKELAAAAKTNIVIKNEELKIYKAQAELGKLFYRDYAVGAEMDNAEYLPWCKKIDESNAVIEDLRAMLDSKGEADFAEAPEDFAESAQPKDPDDIITESDIVK